MDESIYEQAVEAGFVCPITLEIMLNPVVLFPSGKTIEGDQLPNIKLCPETSQQIIGSAPNWGLKSAIDKFIADNPEAAKLRYGYEPPANNNAQEVPQPSAPPLSNDKEKNNSENENKPSAVAPKNSQKEENSFAPAAVVTAEERFHRIGLAAAQGDPQAQFDMGCWHKQNGNYAEANRFYKLAADQGHIEAQRILCDQEIKAQRIACAQQFETQRQQIANLLKLGDKHAPVLGRSLHGSLMYCGPKSWEAAVADATTAARYYKQAAELGSAEALFKLGEVCMVRLDLRDLERATLLKDTAEDRRPWSEEAAKYYLAAIERGYARAWHGLGELNLYLGLAYQYIFDPERGSAKNAKQNKLFANAQKCFRMKADQRDEGALECLIEFARDWKYQLSDEFTLRQLRIVEERLLHCVAGSLVDFKKAFAEISLWLNRYEKSDEFQAEFYRNIIDRVSKCQDISAENLKHILDWATKARGLDVSVLSTKHAPQTYFDLEKSLETVQKSSVSSKTLEILSDLMEFLEKATTEERTRIYNALFAIVVHYLQDYIEQKINSPIRSTLITYLNRVKPDNDPLFQQAEAYMALLYQKNIEQILSGKISEQECLFLNNVKKFGSLAELQACLEEHLHDRKNQPSKLDGLFGTAYKERFDCLFQLFSLLSYELQERQSRQKKYVRPSAPPLSAEKSKDTVAPMSVSNAHILAKNPTVVSPVAAPIPSAPPQEIDNNNNAVVAEPAVAPIPNAPPLEEEIDLPSAPVGRGVEEAPAPVEVRVALVAGR